MLSSDMDQLAVDFPLAPYKPGQYSDKEIPKQESQTKDLCKPTQSKVEQLYQIATSLPVSTALLAVIISQGVPVNGSLWYLNCSAILVILLTTVAVFISHLSVTASHSFCETIFLAIYTPASQLFNVTVNIRDVHQDEEVKNQQQAARKSAPKWFKQFLFISVSMAATKGFTVYSLVYVLLLTLVYSSISTQLKHFLDTMEKSSSSIATTKYCFIITLVFSIICDVIIRQSFGVLSIVYFLLIDDSTVKTIKQMVENKNIEIMEGLEQHYAQGLIQLTEVILTITVIVVQPCFCLLYIPVFYFLIYAPIVEFRVNVGKINSESLCLSNFHKASNEEISSYNDVCAVCLSAMKHARITPCKHIFHGKCLKDCLQKKAQCPMCNSQIL